MPLTVLDATTSSAVAAATTQQAQCEALIAAWAGGNVTARFYSGTTHLDTITMAPFTISGTPREVVCGARLARTHVATGTATKVVFRSGSTDIFEQSVGSGGIVMTGAIKALCAPDLEGVAFTANAALPSGVLNPGDTYLLILGQSNGLGAASRSEISAAPLSDDAGLAIYDAGTFARSFICNLSETTFAALQPSVNNGAAAGDFGPEFGPSVRWMRETTSGNLYIHKQCVSGAPISTFDPDVFPGNDIFFRIGQAQSWLAGQGVTLARKHLLWVQGESNSSDTEAAYTAALQEIIDELYLQGYLDANSIIVLAQMKSGTSGYGQGVFDAKAAMAAASPSTIKTVQMDYYEVDNLHCNGRGQVQLGYDCFEKIFGASHIAT